jgi:hypothetical protein
VSGVTISCADGQIVFDTGDGSHAYHLTSCDIPEGSYTVGVTVHGSTIHFDFGHAAALGQRFRFGWDVAPGQVDPITLFGGQTQVSIAVVDHLPQRQPQQAAGQAGATAPLSTRLANFQRLVKEAGKLRLAQNGRALEQWRQVLVQQLTPAQVETQVHAEEVRSLLDRAQAAGETHLAEQWLQTPGANTRWVLEQQIGGRFHACTGCHATVQAEAMDRDRAEAGFRALTPLQQLAGASFGAPVPSFAQPEQTAASGSAAGYPAVTEARQRVNAIGPYLQALGPDGYKVLPRETLGSAATPSQLVADINNRISQRQADYQTFIHRIDEPDFDYLELRPIVRDLLAVADPDVRQAVADAIDRAETWETIESIVVGAATIGLLLLSIFPPTSPLGIAGTLALSTAVAARNVYRGIQSYEQGQLYSLGRGANDVLDPAQQEAADSLMAAGALNIVMGSIGLASSALGTVRFIRAPPTAGGAGAVPSIEATAADEAGGSNVIRIDDFRNPNAQVTVTRPDGTVVVRPLSSYRTAAAARAGAAAPSPGYVYPTQGGAAQVAQPVPVQEPVPAPPPAPALPAPATTPAQPAVPTGPALGGPLAAAGAAGGVGVVAAAGTVPAQRPVMPAGLSRAEQELWEQCRDLHDVYKATQDAANAVAARLDPLALLLNAGRATEQQRLDFCRGLDELVPILQRLRRERRQYINLDCDRFDWFNRGTTAAQRRAAHAAEAEAVGRRMGNLYRLQGRFCR